MAITRKVFLAEVKKIAKYKSLREAYIASTAVISVLKKELGVDLSNAIADALPPDLREGWESIEAADSEVWAIRK